MFVEGLRKTLKQYEWHHIKFLLHFSQLYIDFKRTHNLVCRNVLCDFLTKYDISMELVRLIKMYLHETCSEIWINKIVFLTEVSLNLTEVFLTLNGVSLNLTEVFLTLTEVSLP